MLSIVQFTEWPSAIEELLDESEQEGFRFVRRAKEEWLAGANRFSKEGEAFWGVFEGARIIAIGGVTHESERCGRLRRVYVRRGERRRGIGGDLVQHALAFARGYYSHVALRCDTETADRFYRAQGFRPTASDAGATHVIDLKAEPNQSLEPTPPAGTSAAEQPLVPAAVVAHL